MDKKARFNSLFDQYYASVLRLCKGYFGGDEAVASDCAQETFLKAWEALDGFRGDSALSTWVYRIAVNTCLLHLRKQSTRKELPTTVFPVVIQENESMADEDKVQKMYACIQKLDEKQKLITLMMLEGVEYPDIAQVVGITEEALRVRIHRIKKNLTKCVEHGSV